MNTRPTVYTLVQHTGYSVVGKPDFKHAVELRSLSASKVVADVVSKGGLIFNTYRDAYKAEHAANYPDGYTGMVPVAKGTFKPVKGLGEDVFVPEKR